MLAALSEAGGGEHWAVRESTATVGGGSLPDSVYQEFVRLAGGKESRIVVIPTASSKAADEATHRRWLETFRQHGGSAVEILHSFEEALIYSRGRGLAACWESRGQRESARLWR